MPPQLSSYITTTVRAVCWVTISCTMYGIHCLGLTGQYSHISNNVVRWTLHQPWWSCVDIGDNEQQMMMGSPGLCLCCRRNTGAQTPSVLWQWRSWMQWKGLQPGQWHSPCTRRPPMEDGHASLAGMYSRKYIGSSISHVSFQCLINMYKLYRQIPLFLAADWQMPLVRSIIWSQSSSS